LSVASAERLLTMLSGLAPPAPWPWADVRVSRAPADSRLATIVAPVANPTSKSRFELSTSNRLADISP
jgi:hypothetical protein